MPKVWTRTLAKLSGKNANSSDVCHIDNLNACGDEPFSFFNSKEAMCSDGSITVVLVIVFFLIIFVSKQILYKFRQRILREKEKDLQAQSRARGPKHRLTIVGLVRDPESEDDGTGGTKISLGEKIGYMLEELFVKPFIPTSIEDMITTMFICWFLLTIPMAVTRFYEERWMNQAFAQQGPFNFVSWAMGCETVDISALPYTQRLSDLLSGQRLFSGFAKFRRRNKAVLTQMEQEKDYFKTIDWYFTIHLMFGLTWLTVGCLQIVWARTGWSIHRDIRRAAHRIFGYFALSCFLAHMSMVSLLAFRNPVKQTRPIQFLYYCDVVDEITQATLGWRWARRAKKHREANGTETVEYKRARKMHSLRMSFMYIKSTFGSGAIRLTVWLLWLVGKFFPFETRIMIDRGDCQSYSKMLGSEMIGQADHCWKPVFLNLAVTDGLVLWLEWLFICSLVQNDEKGVSSVDLHSIKVKFKGFLLGMLLYFVSLYFSEWDWDSYSIILYALYVKLKAIHDFVARLLTKYDQDDFPTVSTAGDAAGRSSIRASISFLSKRPSNFIRSSLLTLNGGHFELDEEELEADKVDFPEK